MNQPASKKRYVVRFLPLIILILALILFFYFGLYEYLTFEVLERYRNQLISWTQQHYVLTVLSFMIIYIIAVAVSIPGATILTITGGFLFGYIFGTIYVVISATIGATIIFLAARTALGEILAKKAGATIKRLEQGFQKNAFNYLLFLRLVPLFPFWLVNIVPGLLNMRLSSYVAATFIGIIPGSFVYVLLGNGVGAVLAAGKTPDLGIILKPEILAPLIGLGILALVPIIYKKYKSKTKN